MKASIDGESASSEPGLVAKAGRKELSRPKIGMGKASAFTELRGVEVGSGSKIRSLKIGVVSKCRVAKERPRKHRLVEAHPITKRTVMELGQAKGASAEIGIAVEAAAFKVPVHEMVATIGVLSEQLANLPESIGGNFEAPSIDDLFASDCKLQIVKFSLFEIRWSKAKHGQIESR